MIVGAEIMIYDHEKFVPTELLQLIANYKVTSSVPSYYIPVSYQRRFVKI